jgi:hypothetical protein
MPDLLFRSVVQAWSDCGWGRGNSTREPTLSNGSAEFGRFMHGRPHTPILASTALALSAAPSVVQMPHPRGPRRSLSPVGGPGPARPKKKDWPKGNHASGGVAAAAPAAAPAPGGTDRRPHGCAVGDPQRRRPPPMLATPRSIRQQRPCGSCPARAGPHPPSRAEPAPDPLASLIPPTARSRKRFGPVPSKTDKVLDKIRHPKERSQSRRSTRPQFRADLVRQGRRDRPRQGRRRAHQRRPDGSIQGTTARRGSWLGTRWSRPTSSAPQTVITYAARAGGPLRLHPRQPQQHRAPQARPIPPMLTKVSTAQMPPRRSTSSARSTRLPEAQGGAAESAARAAEPRRSRRPAARLPPARRSR